MGKSEHFTSHEGGTREGDKEADPVGAAERKVSGPLPHPDHDPDPVATSPPSPEPSPNPDLAADPAVTHTAE
jgi:hypothetical protein